MFNLIRNDVMKALKQMKSNSLDACFCDSPYAIGFMGSKWDKKPISLDPAFWKEVLRVLKPGAPLLAFGGTRTYHRQTCAIEDAGFEIRDCLMWLYGSGFPKSMNISKAIDGHNGQSRPIVGKTKNTRPAKHFTKEGEDNTWEQANITIPASETSKPWEGYGTSLKPAWEPCVLAMKPNDHNFATNALKHGIAGLNLKGCRVGNEPARDLRIGQSSALVTHNIAGASTPGGYNGKTPNPDVIDKVIHYEEGRWPANLLFECICEQPKETETKNTGGHWPDTKTTGFGEFGGGKNEYHGTGPKSVEKCVVHTDPDCPAAQLDAQAPATGAFAPVRKGHSGKSKGIYGDYAQRGDDGKTFYGDRAGASRFFYCAKASSKERNAGLSRFGNKRSPMANGIESNATHTIIVKNPHPCLKPISLTKYLATLLLPPKQDKPRKLLIPFAGVGSEMIGALLAGWDEVIGIEKCAKYVKIGNARIKHWSKEEQCKIPS